MDPCLWRLDEAGASDLAPSPASLAEVVSRSTSMPERLAAAHKLLERCLRQPRTLGLDGAFVNKLVSPLLDMAVEAERLPQVAIKLLWCLASVANSPSALDDAVPTILGILRGTEDTLLAGASLQLLSQLARSRSRALSHQLCNPKAGVGQLLLRCLWRWGCKADHPAHLEMTVSLLELYCFALHVPCHLNMLRAEIPLASGASLSLPEVLTQVADSAGHELEQSIDEGRGSSWVHIHSSQLAREWRSIAHVVSMPSSR